MAIPVKGARRITVDEVTYRWRVAYDRRHWKKGSVSEVRVAVQAADPPGQLLLARFMGCRRDVNDPLNQPFTPGFARTLIMAGLAKSWRPGERVRRPVWVDESEAREAAGRASRLIDLD